MTPAALKKLLTVWPGVTHEILWGADLVFKVGGKMFAVTGMKGGGISFAAEHQGAFEALTQRGKGLIPAPYMAKHFWIFAEADAKYSQAEMKRWLRMSYERVRAKLSKKMQAQLAD